MATIETILHPTDFSDCSRHAFQMACSVARDYNARLLLLYVAEPTTALGGDGVVWIPANIDLEPIRKALEQLAAVASPVAVEHRIVQGEAAREILEAARESRSDLIVMGTHGRSGLGRLIMGSVAEQVVRNAPCSVMTVKVPQEQSVSASSETPLATASK